MAGNSPFGMSLECKKAIFQTSSLLFRDVSKISDGMLTFWGNFQTVSKGCHLGDAPKEALRDWELLRLPGDELPSPPFLFEGIACDK